MQIPIGKPTKRSSFFCYFFQKKGWSFNIDPEGDFLSTDRNVADKSNLQKEKRTQKQNKWKSVSQKHRQ